MKQAIPQFISLEGSEGAGKSTVMQVIASELTQWQIPYIQTREPGGEINAEKIRELLLHSEHLEAKTELLLMFAARNEHVVKVIRPALASGQWVVSDRFVDASYAYQGLGRGLDWQAIEYLEQMVVADTQANLTLLLDVDPQVGLERAAGRSEKDRIEQETLQFFKNIHKGYMQRAKAEPNRIKVIDANVSLDAVKKQIKRTLNDFKQGLCYT